LIISNIEIFMIENWKIIEKEDLIMKTYLIPVAILLVCVFIVTGCGSGTTTPVSTTPVTSQPAATSQAPTTSTTAAVPTTTTVKPTTTIPSATPTPTAASSKYGGTLRWVQPNSPGTPIGWVSEAAGEALRTMGLSIETLVSGQLDGSKAPSLVESYDVVTDPANASATLHLRKGVKFSDGSDFNAQAVAWNLQQTKAGNANASTTLYWKSWDVIDDYTIRINFTVWQNRMTMGLGMPATNMISPTAFNKNGIDWMRTHMVGTGPFMQTDYQQDVVTKTVRNPNYWAAGKPYLDGFQYLYVADELTRVALFKSGGADVLDLASNGRIAQDLKTAGYDVESQYGGCTMLIPDAVNASSPWSNLKVRQAAEYAIDKAALVNAFGFGYSQVAYQMPSPANTAYDPKFAGARTYDVSKAKQLLTDAGYPNGFKTKIIASASVNRDIIVAIQSYLSKVNITTTLDFPAAAQMAAYQQGTWDNALLYTTIFEYPNFNYNLNINFNASSAWYKSKKLPDGFQKAFDASLATLEPDKALIQGLVRSLYDDETVIALNYPAYLSAMTNNVRDTGIYTRITNYWLNPQNAWLAK
jgi:peptide/nickel transport system substrate-binding protein